MQKEHTIKQKDSTSEEYAIKVTNISKTFRIPHEKISSLRGAAVNLFKSGGFEEFQALDDISFEVKKGEFFGIIGRNGSGKSTLLKALAGIYQIDKGKIEIDGLISPFLELGIGFNPELSGRDNIYLNATVLGLSEKEIDKKFDSIVAFSELERFIDQKLKNYSSGMQVRLAFSVSIHANREILLMDEVLAVGDSNFQSKCLEEFNKYKDAGKTVILVTHDIATAQRYCDRAMLLRNGKVVMIGKAEEVGNKYIYQNMSDEEKRILAENKRLEKDQESERIRAEKEALKEAEKLKGQALADEKKRIEEERRLAEEERKLKEEERKNRVAEITRVEFLDINGKEKNVFMNGDDITARIYYRTKKKIERPVFGVALHSQNEILLSGPNTKTSKFNIDFIEGSNFIDFIMPKSQLFTGTYKFTAALYNWECVTPFDFKDKAYNFKIISKEENQNGVMKIENLWKK